MRSDIYEGPAQEYLRNLALRIAGMHENDFVDDSDVGALEEIARKIDALPEPAEFGRRHPVAMTDGEAGLHVLCSDGTVWVQHAELVPGRELSASTRMAPKWGNHRWIQVAHGPIPGTTKPECLNVEIPTTFNVRFEK